MDIISAIFRLQSRKIDIFVPSVVVSEKHSDTLEITEHPVEKPTTGSDSGYIADHAFKRPSEVTMECGFSGGGSLLDFASNLTATSAIGKSPKEMYQELLDLQARRVPFDVITGKRTYKNMLLRAIEVTTDKTTENVLSCTLTLREVIMSQTQVKNVADKSDMQAGVSTSGVQDTGTKSITPVNESLFSRAVNAITGFFGG